MFKLIPNGNNGLDIELSGKLNAEDMKMALDDLVSKDEHRGRGCFFAFPKRVSLYSLPIYDSQDHYWG